MRFEGVLIAWNHEAGYGAIRPFGGGDEVFVGLAAFPTDGEGPRPDEVLSFEIVTARDGRKMAVNLRRVRRGPMQAALREASGAAMARARERHAQRKRRLALVAGGLVCTVLLAMGSVHWSGLGQGSSATAALKR